MTAIDPAAVLQLPAEAKRKLLDALLDDQQAHGIVDLIFPDGPVRIYRPVPNARELAEAAARTASPEELAEALQRADDPDSEFMSVEEVLKIGEKSETLR